MASAAPVRVGGTRARAGNAMGRTRVGILEATGRAVEKYGVRRATMGDVASVAGIAKGTLYNHFRTKNDLLTAAIAAGIEALGDDCVAHGRRQRRGRSGRRPCGTPPRRSAPTRRWSGSPPRSRPS